MRTASWLLSAILASGSALAAAPVSAQADPTVPPDCTLEVTWSTRFPLEPHDGSLPAPDGWTIGTTVDEPTGSWTVVAPDRPLVLGVFALEAGHPGAGTQGWADVQPTEIQLLAARVDGWSGRDPFAPDEIRLAAVVPVGGLTFVVWSAVPEACHGWQDETMRQLMQAVILPSSVEALPSPPMVTVE